MLIGFDRDVMQWHGMLGEVAGHVSPKYRRLQVLYLNPHKQGYYCAQQEVMSQGVILSPQRLPFQPLQQSSWYQYVVHLVRYVDRSYKFQLHPSKLRHLLRLILLLKVPQSSRYHHGLKSSFYRQVHDR